MPMRNCTPPSGRGIVAAAATVCLAAACVAALWPADPEASVPVHGRDVVHAVQKPARPSCGLPAPMRPAFMAAANATRLPVSLLVAVAKVESGMRQTARSPVGAVGLLQLMPETAEQYGLDPRRASENVLAGARYLAGLFDRYSAADTALAAYNAGPTAVDRAGQIAPDGQTLTYVANVDRAWSRLQGCR